MRIKNAIPNLSNSGINSFKSNIFYNISLRHYKTYKNHNWYFRPEYYKSLEHNNLFKDYYPVTHGKDSLRIDWCCKALDSASKDIRNYYKKTDLDFDIVTESSLFEEDEDGYFVKKENEYKQMNTGVFWLYSGDNKKEITHDLFEHNNFLPYPHTSQYTSAEINDKGEKKVKKILHNYYFHLQQAPTNPISHQTYVIEHSFFNIFNLPNYEGKREIDMEEINYFTYSMMDNLRKFSEEKDLDNIIIGGFSQGGCMALHCALTNENKMLGNKIKGVVCLNGFLFEDTPIEYDTIKDLDILMINGLNDEIVIVKEARNSVKRLKDKYKALTEFSGILKNKNIEDNSKSDKRNNPELTYIEENGLYHGFSQTSLSNVQKLIKKIVKNEVNQKKIN